jgi:hypothetical protein
LSRTPLTFVIVSSHIFSGMIDAPDVTIQIARLSNSNQNFFNPEKKYKNRKKFESFLENATERYLEGF